MKTVTLFKALIRQNIAQNFKLMIIYYYLYLIMLII